MEIHISLGILALGSVLSIVWGADLRVDITGTYPPTSSDTQELLVHLNQFAYLTCDVYDKPPNLNVQWVLQTPEGRIIPISTGLQSMEPYKHHLDQPPHAPTSWRLKVQNVKVIDEGSYVCRVQTSPWQNVQSNLTIRVIEEPQILNLQTSSDTTVALGDAVSLRCKATGRPLPAVRWERVDGGNLPTGGTELHANNMNIPHASDTARGQYKCIAESEVGRVERLITLTVTDT